jgi:hypothetical protein
MTAELHNETKRDNKDKALWDIINLQSFFTSHIFTTSFVKIVMDVFYLQNQDMHSRYTQHCNFYPCYMFRRYVSINLEYNTPS